MKLADLILKIKDQSLTKEQLEDYYSLINILIAEIHLELGLIEKESALFLDSYDAPTHAAKESKWRSGEKGQREIVLKRYIKAAERLSSSIKSRIYSKL